MFLETNRLYFREIRQADFKELCEILQDEEVMYAYEHAFSDEEVQTWLERQLQRYKDYGFGLWAVILKETGEMIGQCGLTMQNTGEREVIEVGYLFKKIYWHKGYATEAAIACKNYAFETLKAMEVYSIIRDNNIASQNVARRNGMAPCGTMIKHYYNMDMPHTIFSAKNFKLRPLDKGDSKNIFRLTSNENVARYMRFNTHQREEEAEELLNEYLKHIAFAIEIEENFAGIFVLKESEDAGYTMSVFLDEKFWNKGYTTRILKHIIQYAKEECKAKYLAAYVVYENEGSKKTLIRNGFYESQLLRFPDMQNGVIVYKLNL